MIIKILVAIILPITFGSCSNGGGAEGERAAAVEAAFFSDTALCHDGRSVEMEVVKRLRQLPADSTAVRSCFGSLLREAAGDSVAFRLVNDVLERYLDDPNSPMRSESFYIVYLEELLRLPQLPEAERIRPASRLATARKNRPGMIAADFAYIDRGGRRRTLHRTSGDTPLLLIFYDPECAHCTEILEQVRGSAILRDCTGRESLTVLAVYTEGKRRLWDETKGSMPEEWIVGIDTDSIVERELYDIPAMPVMYLLGRDKKVLLKDAFLPEIEDRLKELP